MGTTSKGDSMSNYDLDEIERKKSQKQKEQWREYVDKSLEHPLGFGRDDRDNIKNVLRNAPKPVQQWDAQTQSYIQFDDDQDNIRFLHENEEVTNPKHYVGLGITPLEYITANELDFLEGNVIKYVTRYPHKGGVNDLLKARTYLEKLIEREVEKS
jgi:hypothetical protein